MNRRNMQISADQQGPWFVLFFLFILALFFDAATTSVFMIENGTDYEIHPVIRAVSLCTGPVYGPLLGAVFKVFAGLFLIRIHRPLSRLILPVVTVLSVFAGVYNIFAWPLYQMGYLQSLPF